MSSIFDKRRIIDFASGACCTLPAVIVFSVFALATPDLETWLKRQTNGFFRPDAFEFLNRTALQFVALVCGVSFCVSLCVCIRRYKFIASLMAGNVVGTLCYLCSYGVSDPAWFSFAALNELGMLVSIIVTAAWVACGERDCDRGCANNAERSG